MARKSRKSYRRELFPEKYTEPVQENKKVPAAIYCRLSKADEITGKESMESQLEIVRQYAAKHEELEVIQEFLDDGYSGTNYERPAFEEMLQGIRDGKFKCMIVKDLSRLGRSYLETSDLLEMELPMYGCRFISVNDHIDTEYGQIDTILVGLKNIMNQKYAEDISKKIKTQFRERAKNGEMLGGPVPYGYKRNPENVGYFLIDEEAAAVVRHIFELKASGLTDRSVARVLDEEGIITPRQYHDLKIKGEEPTEKRHWAADTVKTITKNEVYLGHMYHGKFKEKHYIGEKDHKTRRKEWTIIRDVNPPIVTQELFDKAAEIRRQIASGELRTWSRTRKSPYTSEVQKNRKKNPET